MISIIKLFRSGGKCIFLCMQMLLILASILIFSSSIFAQDQQINFFIDHAQYRLQDDYVYLEVYYSISRQSFKFEQVEEGFQAGGIIKTYISQHNKKMLLDSLFIQDFVKSKDEISSTQRFAQVSMIQIKQGNYLLSSSFFDLSSKKTVTQEDSLYLKSFGLPDLALSDIELANSIIPQKERINKFDKNGLRVMPNASRIYGTGLNELSFYAEAYNLSFENNAKESTYHSIYHILDQQGKTVKEYVGQPKKKPGKSCIIYGALDISDLPSGFYIFKIIVKDDFTDQIAESTKMFNVYKSDDFIASKKTTSITAEKLLEDEFIKMNKDELNEYFDQIRYITLKEEKKIFKKLNVNGKRNFLQNFWRLRDPDPETLLNEKKIEYFQFLDYANKNFSVSNRPGWKTDRGRILLIYGQPDEIERFPSSPIYRAYQIWRYYNVEGGVEFIFVDIRSIRDFQLVHSTHSKEVHDYEWRDRYLKF